MTPEDEYIKMIIEGLSPEQIVDKAPPDTELDEMFDFLEQDPDREISLDMVME